MRFQCYVGIIFVLIVKSESAQKSSCTHYTRDWARVDKSRTLRTCDPNIDKVDEEDFTISSARDSTTLVFNIQDKEGVKFLPTNLKIVFPDLVAIQVEKCSVTSVKENHFKGLEKLRYLSLYRNKIEHIASDAFADLVSLEELGLASNRIQFLGKHTFVSLKALKKLYLGYNEIQFLHPKIFSSLVSVEIIYLEKNAIQSLDENIFETLTNLQSNSLFNNKLERIPKNLFKNNLELKMINFSNNGIKFVDGNMFDHLSRLNYVDLEGNECSNKNYYASDFGDMRDDLKQNCNEVSVQDTLKSLELKCENQKSDLQRQLDNKSREIMALNVKLDSKSREIVTLRQQFDAMKHQVLQTKQKQELLEKNMEANCEVLSKCVDADNETDQGVFITFEG